MIIIIENFISDWLKDILIVFIVISFLEIILPKGKMKKFVDFIIGLLIIFVIISPFTTLEQLKLDIDMQVEELMNNNDGNKLINEQESKIKEVFTNNLIDETKKMTESNSDYEVVDMNISTTEEQDTILIQEVSMTIRESKEDNDEKIAVDQIQIMDSQQPVDEEKHDSIKNLISDYLGIEKDTIFVSEID